MSVTAIVPAAGSGERMRSRLKKPYISLLGQPILLHTLKILDTVSDISHIIVPVYPGEEDLCQQQVMSRLSLRADIDIIAGGETRQESVRNALSRVADSCELVLIHDGARPLVSRPLIEECTAAAQSKQAATAAVPAKDTITMVSSADQTITKSLLRDSLYIIQTPQVFKKELIVAAHQSALDDGYKGTDDASLVERLGIPVTVIMGSYTNIKITTREDLLFAETLLKNYFFET